MKLYTYTGEEVVLNQSGGLDKFWSNKALSPYWILHLDCARKYFSISNIKTLINAMSEAGLNQLQVHFSEEAGFRFALDDMIILANNTSYDLNRCIGASENSNKWYTQDDMDEIISYAHSCGIDVVPSFDMPGHMEKILSTFTDFRSPTDIGTLNVKSEQAVNFALAIVDKYSDYFLSRGCSIYNLGFDEIEGWSIGFNRYYSNGEFHYLTDFANSVAEVLKRKGITPRIYNELIKYNNDSDYNVDRDYEVLYWTGIVPNETLATPDDIINGGYRTINASGEFYWVNNKPDATTSLETLQNADYYHSFRKYTSSQRSNGAVFSIWCDYNSSASDNGDNGNAIVSSVLPYIATFGEGISKLMPQSTLRVDS